MKRAVVMSSLALVCGLLLGWLVYFVISRSLQLPLLRNGFRMVVFSVIIMIVVLFFRRGIMGNRELSDVLRGRRGPKPAPKHAEKEASKRVNVKTSSMWNM